MRLYITGGTGLVGSNIIRLARKRADIEIIASQFGPAPEWDVDYQLDPLDMADTAAVRASIRRYKPDVVIHCAAVLDHVYMQNHRAESWQATVEGNLAFAQSCADVGARYIFVSSDWVFDGQEPLVDEDSPPCPVLLYGFMKAVCERDIMGVAGLSFGIGRLAGIYGINYSNPSLLRKANDLGFDLGNYVIDQLTRGLIAEIWIGPKVNDVAHPTLASDGAEMLLRLAHHDGNGIFHCWGNEPVSRLQFAHHFASVFEIDRTLIAPVPTDPIVLDRYRHIRIPFRIVTSNEKTCEALDRRPYNLLEGLREFRAQWEAFHAPTPTPAPR
ncbi:MAG: sugar nucleotide-binding protein [Chloroflexi bacterium]|nr:sugar nucleotide-binding protein [Chloroflexota bacterium]